MRALLIVCAALVFAGSASAATVEATDLEARMRTPTRIDCSDEVPPGERAYAVLQEWRIVLRSDDCGLLRGPFLSNDGYAGALHALLHELSHIGWQNRDEAATDCFALFVYRQATRRWFGATAAQAQASYLFAWRQHQRLPPEYQADYCRFSARDPLG